MILCPICASDKAYSFISVKQFTYWSCKKCHAAFLPNVDEIEQKRRHEESEYKHARIKVERKHAPHNQWLVHSMKKLKQVGRVLDVGCGSGFLVRAMCDVGFEAIGVDVGFENVEFARSHLGVTVLNQDFLSMTGSLYDVITMHQLIEHLPHPLAYVSHAKSLLADEGLLVLSTPNLSLARILVKLPRPILGDALGHPPNHCVLFEAKTIEVLLHSCGFRLLSIRNNPTGLKTSSRMRHFADKILNASPFVGPNMLIYAMRDYKTEQSEGL
jgi:SAM-dependent methyltransferase